MATTSTSHRVIRLPYIQVGIPAQVLSELLAKLKTLAASQVFITITDPVPNLGFPQQIVQVEFALSSTNDTTLVSSFQGWANLIYGTSGTPVATLDTEVYTTTSGH